MIYNRLHSEGIYRIREYYNTSQNRIKLLVFSAEVIPSKTEIRTLLVGAGVIEGQIIPGHAYDRVFYCLHWHARFYDVS